MHGEALEGEVAVTNAGMHYGSNALQPSYSST